MKIFLIILLLFVSISCTTNQKIKQIGYYVPFSWNPNKVELYTFSIEKSITIDDIKIHSENIKTRERKGGLVVWYFQFGQKIPDFSYDKRITDMEIAYDLRSNDSLGLWDYYYQRNMKLYADLWDYDDDEVFIDCRNNSDDFECHKVRDREIIDTKYRKNQFIQTRNEWIRYTTFERIRDYYRFMNPKYPYH